MWVDTHGKRAECEPITRSGRSPSGVQRHEPLVKGHEEAKPCKSGMDLSTPVHPVATPLPIRQARLTLGLYDPLSNAVAFDVK